MGSPFVSANRDLVNQLTKEDMLAKYRVLMGHRQHKHGETAITFDYVSLDFALMNKQEMQFTAKGLRKGCRKGDLEIRPESNVTKMVEGKIWYMLAIYSIGQFQISRPHNDPLALLLFDMQVSGLVLAFDHEKNRDNVFKFVMG